MSEQLLKGAAAEEALRNYFLSIGYFVVRGCKFRFERFDITDVDLWLYGKSSALNRERLNVDIKNKKTPQAIERIFWAKGLQSVLGLDGCIVATTDARPDVRIFGLQHGAQVLDGAFLSRLTKSGRSYQDRFLEEELLSALEIESLGKLGGDWRGRYERSKSRLLDALTFDGCNAWLEDINYFFEQIIHSTQRQSTGWRMVYFSIASFLIAVDFILREHVAADHDQRRQLLEGGFRYGSAGQAYTEKIGRLAAALVESVVAQPALGDTVQRALHEQAQGVKAEILAEYLSKGSVPSTLFEIARELEAAAFAKDVVLPTAHSVSVQSIIGILADFHGLDRKRILI